jgi:hypothetical protein
MLIRTILPQLLANQNVILRQIRRTGVALNRIHGLALIYLN